MDSQRRVKKIAEWSHRNPNGLQPHTAFPEDYISPGKVHYNVPPIPLDNFLPLSACTMPWHGYTGSRGFFNEQVMPYCVSHYAINDHEKGYNANIEQCKQLRYRKYD